MTPDHEAETLEGLIARLRQYDPYPSTAISETQHKIAKELAPILAGLRAFDTWLSEMDSIYHKRFSVYGEVRAKLTLWIGQPATADQTGAGRGK